MKPRLRNLIVAAGVALLTLAVSTAAQADNGARCKVVRGHYSSAPVPCYTFCTAGDLTGGSVGSYTFAANKFIPSGEATTPGVMFYTGQSTIDLHGGGTLEGTDTGTIDMGGTAKQAALITITDGADGMEGATGYLQLLGTMNLQTGEVQGEYQGEICTP